jgi:hypothetical protein
MMHFTKVIRNEYGFNSVLLLLAALGLSSAVLQTAGGGVNKSEPVRAEGFYADLDSDESDPTTIAVSANGGKFTPSVVQMSVLQHVSISVTAKDRDYTFSIPESGLNYTIKKGTSTEIDLGGIGLGKHIYSCGAGCQGVINVAPSYDGDE